MARAEQKHRHEMDRLVLGAQKDDLSGKGRTQTRGQRYGLLIAVAGLTGAVWAALEDKTTFACTLAGSTLLSLVAVFVTGRIVRMPTGLSPSKTSNDSN